MGCGRFTPELFVNVPHFTHRESEFKGYRFPLGTQVKIKIIPHLKKKMHLN